MKTIHKFQLDNTDSQTIKAGAIQFLDVQIQNGMPCLWVLVDDDHFEMNYTILIYGTGHEIELSDESFDYLATYQLAHLGFVGHVFVPKL